MDKWVGNKQKMRMKWFFEIDEVVKKKVRDLKTKQHV